MRVGCCFTQWVRCIPVVIIADVAVIPEIHAAHKTPTKNVSCEVKAMSVPRFWILLFLSDEWCCRAAQIRELLTLHPNCVGKVAFLNVKRAGLQSGKNFCDKLNWQGIKKAPFWLLRSTGQIQLYSFLFLSENQNMILV